MTPRVLPAARRPKEPSFNLYRPPAVSSTPPEERAFWKWVTTPALGADAAAMQRSSSSRKSSACSPRPPRAEASSFPRTWAR